MKKVLLFVMLLFLVVGCNNTMNAPIKERVVNSLMNQYVEGKMSGDFKKVHSVMPEFVYTNNILYNKDAIAEEYNNNIENYGENFKITYEIKEKNVIKDDALNKLNELIGISFKTGSVASECYNITGIFTYTGTKNSNEEDFNAYYCKYDSTWYLIMN